MSTHLNNNTLAGSLAEPRPKWASARWINVDGISWDVVRVLGQKEGLHRLAVEDLMNRRNRTKVDWYPEGAFGTCLNRVSSLFEDSNVAFIVSSMISAKHGTC